MKHCNNQPIWKCLTFSSVLMVHLISIAELYKICTYWSNYILFAFYYNEYQITIIECPWHVNMRNVNISKWAYKVAFKLNTNYHPIHWKQAAEINWFL